jgi:NAD(P)-dependent dehydrogenase (short-subunit alcohol dehydrogenase family)
MFEDLGGKVAIVTGGASGIGRAAALKLGALGAKLIVATGRNRPGGEEVVRLIEAAGGEAAFVQCDVSVEDDVKRLVDAAVGAYGRLDLAFNNAGIGPDGIRIPYGPLAETSAADFDAIIATNLRGVFLCLKYELLQLTKQGGGGAIVNTSSVGGLRMAPGFGAYGPSKAAVNAITQTAALEYGPAGIRVNAVCPGPTLGTGLMSNSLSADPGAESRLEQIIPLRKFGSVEEVADSVIWLLSEASGHTTGQWLSVDGGMHAM